MRRFCFCALICFAAGCGAANSGELVPLEKLPEGVLQTAQDKLPEVEFNAALKRSDGGYEVRGKDKQGKVRDIEFSASGEVLEVE